MKLNLQLSKISDASNILRRFSNKLKILSKYFRYWFFKGVLFVLLISLSLSLNARSVRRNINTYTDAEKLELIGLIDGWLTENLNTMHGDDFGRFHTTNDYLRWHRDHFQDLEKYILEQDPNSALGYSKYVPFPKWDPNTTVPVYFNGWDPSLNQFNNISSKCSDPAGTGCRTREDYLNTNPGYKFNQNNNFKFGTTNLAPLPAFFKSTGSLCSPATVATAGARTFEFTDFSDYSDFSQIAYHNRGHLSFDNNTSSSQMGSLSSNRASAVYIFWLWHAWVDDMWWDWDANCRHQNNGTTIKDAYDEPNGFTVATGTTRTLNINGNIFKVQGKIIVEPGATLIIENGQILEILDDYFTNQSCDIEVQAGNSSQPGGKLIVRSGAVIRGITSMGQNNGQSQSTDRLGNTIYPDNRVYYLCRWPGIKVYGVKTQDAFSQQHGRVLIDGSGGRVTIQRAHKAILSDEGGIIECKDADFLDCITAVEIKNYLSPHDPNVNLSKFERTNFIIGDQITKYFTNDNMYMHYKHDFHEFKQVVLENIGTINFGGC